ncbi:hypothetical protein CBR_g38566 [Chara braunii]|uniref:Uncharacterized protein n=1 Tax=Chara braunii TaxID=69332 RepID=A0A388K0D1_CHABU|nr:hypothetical protein CBR_g38566 [Chara braunii]|eukprot:GBG63498.1 hypothetical protein CBR_g38566 [Chara braunii]
MDQPGPIGTSTCPNDDDDGSVGLDFRTSFQGSVVDEFHIIPLQLAYLDMNPAEDCWHEFMKVADRLQQFISLRGALSLLKKRKYLTFACEFDMYCYFNHEMALMLGPMTSDVETDTRHRDLAYDFLETSWCPPSPIGYGGRSDTLAKKKHEDDDGDHNGACASGTERDEDGIGSNDDHKGDGATGAENDDDADSVVIRSEFVRQMGAFALSKYSSSSCFRRFGVGSVQCGDVDDDDDGSLATMLYRFASPLQQFGEGIGNAVKMIDFDVFGSDGKCFGLRILVRDTAYAFGGFRASIKDRKGVGTTTIATARRANALDQTTVDLVEGTEIDRQYKPHGNLPLVAPNAAATTASGLNVHFDDSPFAPRIQQVRDHLAMQPFLAARLEIAKIIRVGIYLSYLPQSGSDFDARVRRYRLRLSSLREAKEISYRHFMRVFKGSMWEGLPVELVKRIIDFLPPTPKFMLRPT